MTAEDNYKNRRHSKSDMMNIGIVVHGPEIVDSGYAEKIMEILREYGKIQSRLGGTMGRTAVLDAHLEDQIDISQKLLPSQSVTKFVQEGMDIIFLINYGKSSLTGHTFGYKVQRKCPKNSPIVQIERPGEIDGSVVVWRQDLNEFAAEMARKLDLYLYSSSQIVDEIKEKTGCINEGLKTYRKVAGVSPQENVFVNGMVVGKSTSSEVTLVAEDGIITQMKGGELKQHGVEKLGKIDLEKAVLKTGLLRKSVVKPRILRKNKSLELNSVLDGVLETDKSVSKISKEFSSKLNVAYLDHAAEDIYKLKDADMVVTVGDDTTLIAADILYRFNVPIIGITDGDLDKVVEKGFKALGSLIVELESGWDDLIGEKIFSELFNEKETIEIENIENFKSELIQIISNATERYNIKYN